MKPVILVPRRDDHGHRDQLWAWCKAWWERELSFMPIIEGHHTDGLFNRSAAINTASRLAGDWDVAVIIDSDVICNPDRVRQGIDLALATGKLVLPHNVRKDLSPRGSREVMAGYTGNWDRHVRKTYSEDNGHPSVSSVVIVPRSAWDAIGGFDEQFRGWGYEDTAFAAAAQTFVGIERLDGEVWHFWHPTNPEEGRGRPSWQANQARGQKYRAAIGNADAIRELQNEVDPGMASTPTIPRIIHRTVPTETDPQYELWWLGFFELHPTWQMMTHRDPLDPEEWPLTSPHWGKCEAGAQLADLIRLEALYRWGGIYVDADCEPFRSFESLLSVPFFAAWEDERTIPNAVMGSTPRNPLVMDLLEEAIRMMPRGIWQAGPGVLTRLLPTRSDVLLLPPAVFYPVHYRDPERELKMARFDPLANPWTFVLHHYAGSWLAEKAS